MVRITSRPSLTVLTLDQRLKRLSPFPSHFLLSLGRETTGQGLRRRLPRVSSLSDPLRHLTLRQSMAWTFILSLYAHPMEQMPSELATVLDGLSSSTRISPSRRTQLGHTLLLDA